MSGKAKDRLEKRNAAGRLEKPNAAGRPEKWINATVICVVYSLAAHPASADPGRIETRPGQIGLAGQFGFTTVEDDFSSLLVMTGTLKGRYGLRDPSVALGDLSVGFDWGLVGADSSPEQGRGEGFVGAANPVMSALLVRKLERISWRAGVGTAVPLAWVGRGEDGRLQGAAYNLAMGMRGLWDAWAWAPEHLSIVLPFDMAYLSESDIVLRGEAAAALLFPVGDYDDDADLFLQTAADAGFDQGIVSAGVRLQLVFMPTLGEAQARATIAPWLHIDPHPFFGREQAGASIVPWLRVDAQPSFVAMWATINLSEPLGGRAGLNPFGFQISGGAVW